MNHPKSKILLVDDEPANLELLTETLEQQYQVLVAINGERALRLSLLDPQPDLILLDVVMPGMDGYEVCRRLKADPKTAKIPVIFITSKHALNEEHKGLELGAMDYIAKPFNLSIVQARVRNNINLKKMTDLLEEQAMIDGLTCINNRRHFDEVLEQEWRLALRNKTPLSLIMTDIDFFKRYNDTYGHGQGDECLKKVASSLAHAIQRPTDIVARYGGEEFMALLPNTDTEGAYTVAESFRSHVESLQLPHINSEAAPVVTVSVGVACITPNTSISSNDILKQADQKLYQAKAKGRNQVC